MLCWCFNELAILTAHQCCWQRRTISCSCTFTLQFHHLRCASDLVSLKLTSISTSDSGCSLRTANACTAELVHCRALQKCLTGHQQWSASEEQLLQSLLPGICTNQWRSCSSPQAQSAASAKQMEAALSEQQLLSQQGMGLDGLLLGGCRNSLVQTRPTANCAVDQAPAA